MEDALVGRLLKQGTYRLESVLGAGGMGTVYRATQLSIGRAVAVKVLEPERLAGSDAATVRARFRREATAMSRLRHPSTVRVLDFGEAEDGLLWLAMELVEGETLRELLGREGPLAAPRVARLGAQIARALAEAHAAGIVHRDLKPSNLLVDRLPGEGELVRVADFGVAALLDEGTPQLTRSDAAVGTPSAMAPEQVTGAPIGPGADLYALGLVLYEALTGEGPFAQRTPMSMMVAHLHEPAPRLVLPGVAESERSRWCELVTQLLEKQPEERPAGAAEVAQVLEGLASTGEAAVRSLGATPAPEDVTPMRQRVVQPEAPPAGQRPNAVTRAVILGVMLAIVGAALVALFATRSPVEDSEPRREARENRDPRALDGCGDGRLVYVRDERAWSGRLVSDPGAAVQLVPGPGQEPWVALSPAGHFALVETTALGCGDWACLVRVPPDRRAERLEDHQRAVIHATGNYYRGGTIRDDGAAVVVCQEGPGGRTDLAWRERDDRTGRWSEPRVLTEWSPWIHHSEPALSVDGERLVFSCRAEPSPGEHSGVCSQSLVGDPGPVKVLVAAEVGASHPALGPGGDLIYIAEDAVWRLAPDQERPLRLTPPEPGQYVAACSLPSRCVAALEIYWSDEERPRIQLLDERGDRVRLLETQTGLVPPSGLGCQTLGARPPL